MTQCEPGVQSPGNGPRPIGWQALFLWLPGSLVAGLLLGGAAAVVQRRFAPLVFFPLLIGALLGLMLVGWLRTTQTAQRAVALLGVLLAVCGAVFVEHYVCYRTALHDATADERLDLARQAFPEQAGRLGQAPVPDHFWEFMRSEAERGRPLIGAWVAKGAWAWCSWSVEAALTLVAALAVVVPALRLPYCARCRSWYRTTRSGRLRASVLRRLAAELGIEWTHVPPAARYRVLTCESGCGPMGLELSWRSPRRERERELAWLDESQRLAVLRVLDENRDAEAS